MTADEAKQALKQGKKVRCVKWLKCDYIIEMGELISYRDMANERAFEHFKDDDWEIVE